MALGSGSRWVRRSAAPSLWCGGRWRNSRGLACQPGLGGAYAAASGSAPERVWLDREWLAMDQRLNGALDSPGDEGEIFSALLRGVAPSAVSAGENDLRWVESRS